ncbi:MAG TPA: DNA-directed RNA polymerase subunit omega [Candidatus Acidoferrales bacterium]|nr:DNA-directed RNA polymerase subunit omega [Candidatus Acidoferrales bacterium]
MIPLDKIETKFAFVLAAAKRARQLQAGAKPLVPTTAHKFTRMAMEEVAGGAVPFDLPTVGEDEEAEGGKVKKGKGKRSK